MIYSLILHLCLNCLFPFSPYFLLVKMVLTAVVVGGAGALGRSVISALNAAGIGKHRRACVTCCSWKGRQSIAKTWMFHHGAPLPPLSFAISIPRSGTISVDLVRNQEAQYSFTLHKNLPWDESIRAVEAELKEHEATVETNRE